MLSVRAKFKVSDIIPFGDDPSRGATVRLDPVYSEDKGTENWYFWNATPSGQITMNINNPEAIKGFEEGKEYYVDFTAVE